MSRMITNIVFSRNRPLQLDAYLEGLYRHFGAEQIQTYIIYKVELFSEEYESLFEKYPDCIVMRETDFHSDCVKLINQAESKYILFGVDDVVFFDSVNLELIDKTFSECKDEIFGFSLRLSRESLKDGNDVIGQANVDGQKVCHVDWKNGQTPHSRYPFELCCTIYPTTLVQRIINGVMNNNAVIKGVFLPNSVLMRSLGRVSFRRRILKLFGYFFNPNTLESWNCRWCQNNPSKLPPSLFFQKQCAAAIQVNTVNTTTNNESDGLAEQTVEALNEKYKQGYRLNIAAIESNKPALTHCGQDHFELIRNQ